MRALAVFGVVWHHAHPGYGSWPITEHGFLGVDLFFILSGFLITSLLLDEHSRNGTISLKHFYARRALRIFPLYFLVLGLVTAVALLRLPASEKAAIFLSELPYHLSYTSNWVHLDTLMSITWSLSAEEQFYLIWPPLLVLLGTSAVPFLLVFLGLNQLVNFGTLETWLPELRSAYVLLPMLQITFTPIVMGALVAFVLREPAARRWLERRLPSFALGVSGVLWLVVANFETDHRGVPRLALHLLGAAFLIWVVLNQGHKIVQLLECRQIAHVGKVSYGVYLLHMLVIDVVVRGTVRLDWWSAELTAAAAVLGSVLLASASYRWFEMPFLRMKHRFR